MVSSMNLKSQTTSDEEQPDTPERDSLTGGLTRPLDYAETLALFAFANGKNYQPNPRRFYASDIGRCIRFTFWKRTDEMPDADAREFEEGVGERGNAVEDRITKRMRQVHGEDVVLQNVRLSKVIQVPVPGTKGEDKVEIAIICKTDPVVIGDNLEVLQLLEIKTKSANYWKGKNALTHWPDQGLFKVPLHLAKIEEKHLGIAGAASLHNAMQLSLESRILRENGREPKQNLLIYVNADHHAQHLAIVLRSEDVTVLSDLAGRQIREVMGYILSGEVPPPLFAMPWECGYCPYQKKCALLNKEEGDDRRLNPIFGEINARLDKARKEAQK